MTPHFGKERFSAKKGKKHKMQCLMQAEQPQEENLQDFVVKGRTERAPPPSQSVQDKKGGGHPALLWHGYQPHQNQEIQEGQERTLNQRGMSTPMVHSVTATSAKWWTKDIVSRGQETGCTSCPKNVTGCSKNPSSVQEQGSPPRKLPRQRNQFCERKNGEHPSCTRDFRNAVLW